jgi:hypothetical protein
MSTQAGRSPRYAPSGYNWRVVVTWVVETLRSSPELVVFAAQPAPARTRAPWMNG